MKERPFLATLNGGEVSPLALARIDLKRMQFTAERMSNVTPRVIGAMQLRSGLGYQGSTASDNQGRNIPFIFAADDTALVELTNLLMRVIIDGTALTRVSVATVVTNGDFSSGVGWTLTVTGSGTSVIAGGVLTLTTPARGGTALAKRSVTVAGADQNKEHGLRIVVTRGPVVFRCGSTDGGEEYIRETQLSTGTYSLTLTPTGNFFVQLSSTGETHASRIVDSITVEAAGVVSLTAPWAAADLPYLRWVQSGDVIFVTNTQRTYQPYKIERRSTRAWGLAKYEFSDGPFRGKTANVNITPSAKLGDITLTASAPFFRTDQVGALIRMFHSESETQVQLASDDTFTDTVKVHGVAVNGQRDIDLNFSGVWSGTISLQVSYDDGLTWAALATFTGNGSSVQTITGDNADALVRLGFVGSDWTSGTATARITYDGGGGWGVARITAFTSSTSVSAEVTERLHDDFISRDWEEGRFSALWGWPSAVELFEGRLWFCDNDKLFGSLSDDFFSFDLEEEGDSGTIIRTIATGPVNKGLWMLGLGRLIVGTVGAESVGRSSSFDEPITPTNFSIKDASTQGSANIAAVKVDKGGLFIQRNGQRAYFMRWDGEAQDYGSSDVSRYNPTILGGDDGTVHVLGIAVQRQPDTRIWFWLSDGTATCVIYEPSEDVIAWFRFETDGTIEDITVLPNEEADDVYMIVQRTINAVTKRYREKLAYDHQARGGDDNFMADAYVTSNIVATSIITGLSHLEGEEVVAWVDGSPMLDAEGSPALFTVTGAQINIGTAMTGQAIVGLPYTGQWKSVKLAYGAQMGTAVSQPKIIKDFAPLLYKTHQRALRYGRDFNSLSDLPLVIDGVENVFDTMLDAYDGPPLTFEGGWSTDSRICLEMRAPLPCTVLGLAGAIETNERG